jgi:TrpR-related protein YerC/YecD
MENYPRWRDELTDQLFKAILLLKNEKECYSFFEDLATINEIKELSQRIEVARMLNNSSTYEEIAHKTGTSSATISRVKRCLNYGADGYKLILERLFGKKK